jgi:cyclohexa-1,5-dienecarbonyl-CoA hydratase
VDEIAENPGEAALAYARSYLMPRSASSLRWAVRAARQGFASRFLSELAEVERTYLEDLMGTSDALEGLQAFLEKRPPQWRNA